MIADGARGLFGRAIIQSAPLGIASGREAMTASMARSADTVDPLAGTQEFLDAQQRILTRINGQISRYGFRAAMPFGTQYGYPPLPREADRAAAWREAAPHVEVLIGHTSREVAFFLPGVPELATLLRTPVLGRLNRRMFVATGTRKIYAAAAGTFARQQRSAGGSAYTYNLSFGAPGSLYAGAHSVELPLLFPNHSAWNGTPLVAGESCEKRAVAGAQLRAIWAGFARTGHVATGTVDGLITMSRD
jgi:para-nitrobenzyl esterase